MNNLNTSISEILNAQHKEDVTSEPAQLERLKQAGINTDLNGGSALSPQEPGDIALPENLPAPQNAGENLLTFSGLDGLDAESPSDTRGAFYSNVKKISLGLKVSF